jgi:exosortase
MADVPGSFTSPAAKLRRNKSSLDGPIKPVWIGVACAFAVVLSWAYWPTFKSVVTAWLSNPDYTHGFFVIPISLWLLWLRREHAPLATMRIDWRGLSLLLIAGAIRVVAGRFYVLQLDAWSIPLWVAGVVWLLFGWPLLRWALPAIAFLWFATPLPGTIEIFLSTPLQRLAAGLSAWALRLIGQPALVQGTTILLDDMPLDVERACSGLRMFYGIFALAVACVALSRPERWKAVLVLFAAGPVAIIANVFRIVITALLMKFASNETAQKFSHDLAGIVMIPLAVTLFLLFLVALGRVVNRMRDPRGVAWLIKWCVAGVVLMGAAILWGRHQDARALTTFLDTATRYESQKDWGNAVKYLSLYVRSVPDDHETFTRLAKLYQTHAGGYQEHLRAVDLLKTAWKNQPEKEDLAVSAVQVAVQIQDFDNAIQIAFDLLAKTKNSQTRSKATKLKAEALHAYLLSDKNRGDYNWSHVKDAFEAELKLPDYDTTHAIVLADVYRNPKTNIKNIERDWIGSSRSAATTQWHGSDVSATG